MNISVLTICTRGKLRDHPRKLRREDFASGQRRLGREQELAHLATLAGAFYTGLPQRRLVEGLAVGRAAGLRVDLWILSAGYGLIHEAMPVVPYDCSFNGLHAAALAAWARHLAVPDAVPLLLSAHADLRLVLLTEPYLRACALPPDQPLGAPTVFITSHRTASIVPQGACAWVLRRDDVGRFRAPAVALRQVIGARVLRALASDGEPALARLLAASRNWRDELSGQRIAGPRPR